MKCKRNWFYSFCVTFSGILLLYAFTCCFSAGTARNEETYFYRCVLLAGLLAGLTAARFMAWMFAKFRLEQIFDRGKKWIIAAEIIMAAAILTAAFFQRLNLISEDFHELNENETMYYEAAQLMAQGNLRTQGEAYCDMLAISPYRMGYVWLLKTAFSVWGIRMEAGQYLNLFFSVAGIFFLYRIGRKLSGRTGGIVTLLLGAFWPGNVSNVLVLTEEAAFLFFAFGCGALLVHLLTDYDQDHGRAGICFAGCILLGALMAMGAMLSLMMLFFLASVILVVFPQKLELPNKPLNDIPLLLRFIHHGWVRCLLIVVPFLLLYGILLTNIEMAIDRDTTWFGDFFTLSYFSGGIGEIMSGLAGKFEQFWRGIGIQAWFLEPVIFAGLLGMAVLRQGGGSFLYIYVLWFLGMTGINLVFENRTLTLSPVLSVLFLFAGNGAAGILAEASNSRAKLLKTREEHEKREENNKAELDLYRKAEEEVIKIREEALANVFDMQYALEHGHVIMTVSEAYKQGEAQKPETAEHAAKADTEESGGDDSWEQIEKARNAYYGRPSDKHER